MAEPLDPAALKAISGEALQILQERFPGLRLVVMVADQQGVSAASHFDDRTLIALLHGYAQLLENKLVADA